MSTRRKIKKLFNIMMIIILVIISPLPLFSQVAINQSEVLDIFNPSKPLYTILGLSGLIDIGETTGPNVYNFNYISPSDTISIHNYEVNQIPILATRYPLNAITFSASPQYFDETPILYSNGDSTYYAGVISIEDSLRFLHYSPYEVFAGFPLTYGSYIDRWVEVHDTTYDSNLQVLAAYYYLNQYIMSVDGYGFLNIFGDNLPCLRQKREYPFYGYKEFYYATKEGVLLVVTDVELTEPDTGYINADYQVFISDAYVGIKDKEYVPYKFILKQNYPNPFNPITTIEFDLPINAKVTLKIFNLLGEEVATLLSSDMLSGHHSEQWDARVYPNGIYYYQIQAGKYRDAKKMILIK